MVAPKGWYKVVFADECPPCAMCGEARCPVCEVHYFECSCPGPTQDDMYEYEEFDGVLYARPYEDDDDGLL